MQHNSSVGRRPEQAEQAVPGVGTEPESELTPEQALEQAMEPGVEPRGAAEEGVAARAGPRPGPRPRPDVWLGESGRENLGMGATSSSHHLPPSRPAQS